MTGSLFQLVMADEIIGMCRRICQGIEVTENSIALDTIREVGPGGNFLSEDHTLANFKKEHWQPCLMDRFNYEAWVSHGEKTMSDRIKERTREILDTHKGPKVSEAIQKKITSILEDAEKRERKNKSSVH